MRTHLLAISIGPVQGFISAARRTRDFWMGSVILSEIAKSVAKKLVDKYLGGDTQRLIFPAPTNDDDLQPIDRAGIDRKAVEGFNATNVLLCRVDAEAASLKTIAAVLKEAAHDRWAEFATSAREALKRDEHWKNVIAEDRWEQQFEARDVVEFYSAWTPLTEDYAASRLRVMRLLAGRKALRDFKQWAGEAGVPKSSLDGARETVLQERYWDDDAPAFPERLRIRPKEQLDLVGLTKRMDYGQNKVRFPSVSRFAVDPWIRGVLETGADYLEAICNECEKLGELKALRQRGNLDTELFPWLKSFPFEGSPLFRGRHEEIVSEAPVLGEKDKEGRRAEIRAQCKEVMKAVEEVCKSRSLSKPSPYLAVLIADGDHMGRTIANIDQAEGHRKFSAAQSDFVASVRDVVRQKYCGACAYTGADDVMALLPVDMCLACARHLHDMFSDSVGQQLDDKVIRRLGSPPKLSVGIAIVHCMEPLEDLLDYARAAEKLAKNPTEDDEGRGQYSRNGLCVAIHPRGGAAFRIRDNWKDGGAMQQSIDRRILRWADLYNTGGISSKAAYDLRELSRDYSKWSDEEALAMALQHDAKRVFGRKRSREGDERREITELLKAVRTPDDLRTVANELLVGSWIARSIAQAAGKAEAVEEVVA